PSRASRGAPAGGAGTPAGSGSDRAIPGRPERKPQRASRSRAVQPDQGCRARSHHRRARRARKRHGQGGDQPACDRGARHVPEQPPDRASHRGAGPAARSSACRHPGLWSPGPAAGRRRDPLQVTDLVNNATLTKEMADFLKACVNARMNIVVAGGGASGKTTTLNVLSSFIPHDERIITVEDAAELQLRQVHVINLESRPSNVEGKGGVSIRDLVINTLRMRPDRIVVGEVRSGEALDMLQAMNTGH